MTAIDFWGSVIFVVVWAVLTLIAGPMGFGWVTSPLQIFIGAMVFMLSDTARKVFELLVS